jgi:hypothetical protein
LLVRMKVIVPKLKAYYCACRRASGLCQCEWIPCGAHAARLGQTPAGALGYLGRGACRSVENRSLSLCVAKRCCAWVYCFSVREISICKCDCMSVSCCYVVREIYETASGTKLLCALHVCNYVYIQTITHLLIHIYTYTYTHAQAKLALGVAELSVDAAVVTDEQAMACFRKLIGHAGSLVPPIGLAPLMQVRS